MSYEAWKATRGEEIGECSWCSLMCYENDELVYDKYDKPMHADCLRARATRKELGIEIPHDERGDE